METYQVYVLTNRLNGKLYVGCSNDYERRYREHRSIANNNRHENSRIQEDRNAYPNLSFDEIFKLSLIKDNIHKDEIELEEQYYISFYSDNYVIYNYHKTKPVYALDLITAKVTKFDSRFHASTILPERIVNKIHRSITKEVRVYNYRFFSEEQWENVHDIYEIVEQYRVNCQPVVCMNVIDNNTCVYDTVQSASENTGIRNGHISRSCGKGGKKCGNYIFFWQDKYNESDAIDVASVIYNNNFRPVISENIATGEITKWDSKRQYHAATNDSNIYSCFRGTQKSSRGLRFFFQDEY